MPTIEFTSQDEVIIELENASGLMIDVSDSVGACRINVSNSVGRNAVFGRRLSPTTEGTSTMSGSLTAYESIYTNSAHNILMDWLVSDLTKKPGLRDITFYSPNQDIGSFRHDVSMRGTSYDLLSKTAGGDGTAPGHELSLEVHDYSYAIIT
ncbi:hypothetical protein G4Y79_05225 [Phototrophicus methaneseepsis]|uniref:Uncharacterized protein n=1 Tax=Phototrophicus methaneseepsis TaxID=2710758 RepID=A0A7S8EB88_9CHLR|nr:hypothetical protein [Phototrophicus methaneseepsis]QPC83782.1 hypothetical protein G4Y79_05225 [Phototrophicus methaneseepsis]